MNDPRLGEILFTERQIQRRVQELADEISADYRGKNLLLVGVLKGAYMFLADLARALSIDAPIDFIGAASYEGTESTGKIVWTAEPTAELREKRLLVVEDIIDTGRTANRVIERLKLRSPASIHLCAMFSKTARRELSVSVRYIGFPIPDKFIVGYGLDHNGAYRNLPYAAALEEAPSDA